MEWPGERTMEIRKGRGTRQRKTRRASFKLIHGGEGRSGGKEVGRGLSNTNEALPKRIN